MATNAIFQLVCCSQENFGNFLERGFWPPTNPPSKCNKNHFCSVWCWISPSAPSGHLNPLIQPVASPFLLDLQSCLIHWGRLNPGYMALSECEPPLGPFDEVVFCINHMMLRSKQSLWYTQAHQLSLPWWFLFNAKHFKSLSRLFQNTDSNNYYRNIIWWQISKHFSFENG